MEKSVRLNTAVVVKSREANTVLAIKAAFVDKEDGNGGAFEASCTCANGGSTGATLDNPEGGAVFCGFEGT